MSAACSSNHNCSSRRLSMSRLKVSHGDDTFASVNFVSQIFTYGREKHINHKKHVYSCLFNGVNIYSFKRWLYCK